MKKEFSSNSNKVNETIYSTNHPDSVFFTMKKSACLGQCPVYNLTVYHSGKAELDGRDFIEFKGLFTGQISSSDMDSIYKSIEQMNYFSLENEYDAPITDVPSTTTEFFYKDQKHKVRNRWKGPKALKELEKYIHRMVMRTNWTKVE